MVNAILAHLGRPGVPGVDFHGLAREIYLATRLARREALALCRGRGDASPLIDTRPGIVHRLDKDTTGVIIVAKDTKRRRRYPHSFTTARREGLPGNC